MSIRTVALQRDAHKDFIVAAYQLYNSQGEEELLIFHPSATAGTMWVPAKKCKADWGRSSWSAPFARPARPWSSVILPEEAREDVLRDMQSFMSEKEVKWYAARGTYLKDLRSDLTTCS